MSGREGATLDGNVAKAEKYLARFARDGVQHFIDGTRARRLRADVRDALAGRQPRAREGRRGRRGRHRRGRRGRAAGVPSWRDMPGEQRRAMLHKIADAIEARADEIALVESLDTGQPIRFMSEAAMRGAENFRFFADSAPEAARRPVAAGARARQLHDAPADRSGGASSRRGTRRSCCRPGRSRRRSRPAARSCTSRPNGARSRRRCSRRSAPRRACRPACSTPCTASARRRARPLTEHPAIQGDRVRRRVGDRQRDHGAGRAAR